MEAGDGRAEFVNLGKKGHSGSWPDLAYVSCSDPCHWGQGMTLVRSSKVLEGEYMPDSGIIHSLWFIIDFYSATFPFS